MKTKLTYTDLMKAARFELRRHGFRADGGSMAPNSMEIVFDEEPATGQMGFSCDSITPSVRWWAPGVGNDMDELLHPQMRKVDLRVCYNHRGGGSNGYDMGYIVVRPVRWGEVRELKLTRCWEVEQAKREGEEFELNEMVEATEKK